MKKRAFLLFVILSILSAGLASAQDIIIGGKSYPLIIIIPFILVVSAWAVIMLIWVSRNIHNIALFFFNLGKKLSKFFSIIGLGRISDKINEMKEKREAAAEKERKGKIEEEEEKKETKKQEKKKKDLTPYLEKVSAIEDKLPKFKEDVIFKNLADVIRSFFATLLNMQHEFTETELQKALEKKKKGLVEFTQKLVELKYSGKPLTKQELRSLIDEFKHIVEHYVKAGWRPQKVVKSPMEKLVEQDKKILGTIRGYLDFLKQESRKSQIEGLLEDERKVLGKNIHAIKKRYNKMLKLYVQLSPREKALVYPQLIEFYNNINKALFSTVYSKKSKEELDYFAEQLKRLRRMPKKEPFMLKLKKAFAREEKPSHIAIKGKKLKVKIKPRELPYSEPLLKRLFKRRPKPAKVKIPKVKRKKVAISAPSVPVRHTFGYKLKQLFTRQEIAPEKIRKRIKLPEKYELPAPPKPKKPLPSMEPLFKRLVNVFQKEEGIPTKKLKVPKAPLPPKKEKEKRELPEEEKQVVQELDRLIEAPAIEKVDYVAKIRDQIREGKAHLKAGNIRLAEKVYYDLGVNYANLSAKEKKRVHKSIIKFFELIKKARKKAIETQKKILSRKKEMQKKAEQRRKELEREEREEFKKTGSKASRLDQEKKKLFDALEKLEVPDSPKPVKYVSKKSREPSVKKQEERKKSIEEVMAERKKAKKAMKKLEKEQSKIAGKLDRLKEEL